MTDKWTPGPWRYLSGDSVVNITTESGDSIAATTRKRYYEHHDATDLANAALIAAAPDMAEALHNMIALAAPHFTDAPQKLALSEARAALAKARGQL